MTRLFAPLVLGLLLLAGCALGPDFVRPEAELSGADLEAGGGDLGSRTTPEGVPNEWWRLFGDPVLDSLEERAAAANLDLMAAYARIERSRAALGVATAGLLPTMGAEASYAHTALSADGRLHKLGAPTSQQDYWGGAIGAAWELDIWGRNRRIREGAQALRLSKIYEKELVHVSLSADVAGAYIALRSAQRQLAVARDGEKVAGDCLRLVQTRWSNGAAAAHEVSQAKAELARRSALVTDAQRQVDVLMNGLALLLALPPKALEGELKAPAPVPQPPALVPVGVPSDLARRRPDIRKAEQELHAATAAIGAAKADFYPSVTLSGTVGLESLKLKDLDFWDSRFYSAGPGLRLPIFQGGRLLARLEMTKAEQAQAALAYRSAVLRAWHEIDDALLLFSADQRRCEQLKTSLEESRRALEKVRRSYSQGASAYLEVLTAQRDVLAGEAALEAASASRSQAMVALYRAVGGGWDDERLVFAD